MHGGAGTGRVGNGGGGCPGVGVCQCLEGGVAQAPLATMGRVAAYTAAGGSAKPWGDTHEGENAFMTQNGEEQR